MPILAPFTVAPVAAPPPAPLPPREPKLMMRRALGCGTLVLLTRRRPDLPWIEICRAKQDNPAAIADLDRSQQAFNTPLVREVFLELTDPEHEEEDIQ